jgi:hypothetical protein
MTFKMAMAEKADSDRLRKLQEYLGELRRDMSRAESDSKNGIRSLIDSAEWEVDKILRKVSR